MPSPESKCVFVWTSVSSRSRTSVLLRPLDVLKVGGEGKNRSERRANILSQSDFLDEGEEPRSECLPALLCGGLWRRENCLFLIACVYNMVETPKSFSRVVYIVDSGSGHGSFFFAGFKVRFDRFSISLPPTIKSLPLYLWS